MSKKLILTLVKTVLPLLIGSYLIWHSFSSMSEQDSVQFYKAIKEANYFWIIISMILGFVAFLSRAYRWKYVLEPLGYKTKFWNRYHAVMIGYIMNLTIPRAGEASRSAMLYRSDGIPFTSSFGTIIAERAVDLVVLILIACLTAFLGFSDFLEIKSQIQHKFNGSGSNSTEAFTLKMFIYSGIIIIGCVFCYFIIFNRKFRLKVVNFSKDIVIGLLSIFKLKQPFAYLFFTLVIWGAYIAMFAMPFLSLDQTASIAFPGILLAFIAGSLGIMFTNGGIGTFPLLVGLVVAFYIGKDHPNDAQAIGNALGMLLWVSQTLIMIVLGLISLILLPNNFKKEDESIRVSGE